jgi:hypothetical protein
MICDRTTEWTARAVFCCVTCKHLIIAAALAFSNHADKSTGVATLLLVIPDHAVLVAALLVASLLTLWVIGGTIAAPLWCAAALVPQQLLAVIPAIGAGREVVLGQYADGYVPQGGWLFILVDQAPRIILAIVHSVAIWRHLRQ